MENKLINAIQYYVDEPATNYAIMINGKWGSGKTYFWKNTLVKVLEEKGMTPIYISLYGVSSIEQIGKKILLGLMKLSDLGPKGKSGEILKIAINALGSISIIKDKLPDLNKVLEGVEFHNLADMDKVILCFDDLERVNMNISDIFGFINSLAEHDNAKIIILTDERKISEKHILNKIEEKTISVLYYLAHIKKYIEDDVSKNDNNKSDIVSRVNTEINRFYERSDEYKTIKEKLIGKTIDFEVDYKHIIYKLVEDLNEKNMEKDFICSRKDTIYDIFNKSNVKNLRILNHSIKDFGQLYSILSYKIEKLEETVMDSLLIFVIAFSLEVKSGVINKNVFQNVRTLSELESKLFEFHMFPTDDNKKLSSFFDKYFIKGKHDDCDFVEVQKYLISNVIDEEAFIMGYRKILESGEVSLDLKLLSGDFTLLSDEEFSDAHEIAYIKIKNGEYPCAMYLHIFNRYYQFVELGALIIEPKDLEIDIHDGLKKAAEECNDMIDVKFMAMGHEGFLETEYGKNLIRLYEEINQQIADKKMNTIEGEIIEAIKMPDNFHLNTLFEYNCSKPLFKYIDAEKLFNTIISLDNKRLTDLILTIKKRHININEKVLIDDAKSLIQLSARIKGHIENKEVSFSVSLLNYLSKAIDNALEKIDLSQIS